jgi:hypothetical protein
MVNPAAGLGRCTGIFDVGIEKHRELFWRYFVSEVDHVDWPSIELGLAELHQTPVMPEGLRVGANTDGLGEHDVSQNAIANGRP